MMQNLHPNHLHAPGETQRSRVGRIIEHDSDPRAHSTNPRLPWQTPRPILGLWLTRTKLTPGTTATTPSLLRHNPTDQTPPPVCQGEVRQPVCPVV